MIAKRVRRAVSSRRSLDNRLNRTRSLQWSDFRSSSVGMDDDNDNPWSVIYTDCMTQVDEGFFNVTFVHSLSLSLFLLVNVFSSASFSGDVCVCMRLSVSLGAKTTLSPLPVSLPFAHVSYMYECRQESPSNWERKVYWQSEVMYIPSFGRRNKRWHSVTYEILVRGDFYLCSCSWTDILDSVAERIVDLDPWWKSFFSRPFVIDVCRRSVNGTIRLRRLEDFDKEIDGSAVMVSVVVGWFKSNSDIDWCWDGCWTLGCLICESTSSSRLERVALSSCSFSALFSSLTFAKFKMKSVSVVLSLYSTGKRRADRIRSLLSPSTMLGSYSWCSSICGRTKSTCTLWSCRWISVRDGVRSLISVPTHLSSKWSWIMCVLFSCSCAGSCAVRRRDERRLSERTGDWTNDLRRSKQPTWRRFVSESLAVWVKLSLPLDRHGLSRDCTSRTLSWSDSIVRMDKASS